MTYNLKPTLETERKYEMIEMRLSDTNAVVPKALCGAETSHDLRDLKSYLEDRLYEVPVGAVCQDCKAWRCRLQKSSSTTWPRTWSVIIGRARRRTAASLAPS